MTTIDPSGRLAAAVREQLAALRERPGAARSGSTGASQRQGAESVARGLPQRLQAIAPDDPDRPRKAVRLLLEAELAREFGAALVNDPGFPAMLDAVQERMGEDAQLASSVEALGRLLLAGKLAAG